MNESEYKERGYRVDVSKSSEAMTSNAVSYIGFAVGLITILSYFFFESWLLELLIVSFFITSLKMAFLRHLTDEALKQERLVTNEEFFRMSKEIEEIKEKRSNK